MISPKQLVFLLCTSMLLAAAVGEPDGGDYVPLPGPGLAYGGIPYGSMSGNVAEFFRKQAAPSGRSANYVAAGGLETNYAPIEQYL